MKRLFLLFLLAMAAMGQKPLDLVVIVEPVEWGDSAGKVSRTSEELKLRPEDRVGVVELIGAPKIKSKLGEGKTNIGMRWRPTFRFGAASVGQPEPVARIYDAIELATRMLPDEYDPARQRAILLITADEEMGSKVKLGDVQAALKASQARVMALAVPADPTRRQRGVSVKTLVEDAGGSFATLNGVASVNAGIEKLRR